MEQIRVFISHCSEDKPYLHKLVDIIGKNGVAIDELTFGTGQLTRQEIITAIEQSGIFVLLISKICLQKDWVKEEIKIIKRLLDDKAIKKFNPYIIDESIDYSYSEIAPWIRDDYNLRIKYSNPAFLARKINSEIEKLIWNKYPKIARKSQVFLGRNNDMEELQRKYYEKDLKQRRAVVVSGIPNGIGRRRLLTELIKNIETNKDRSYEPFSIALDKDSSIEDFIIQLNFLFHLHDNEKITQVTSSSKEIKLKCAIEFIRFMSDKQERLFIRDNGSCILNDGTLSTWFEDVILSADIDQTLFYISSRYRFREYHKYPQIVSLKIEPLSQESAIMLLKGFLEIDRISLTMEQAKSFISKTKGLPPLISKCADIISELGPDLAEKDDKGYSFSEDGLVKSLLSEFKSKRQHLQVLILLSELPFITYNTLKKATNGIIDDLDSVLSELYNNSVYETFGSNNQYYRMNWVFADYINRSRLKHNEDLWGKLQEQTHDIIERIDFENAELGLFLQKIENEIRGDTRRIKKSHIIPSIAIKILNDEYRKQTTDGNRNVVDLCLILLDNDNSYYNEVIESIHYLLCAAYARMGNEKFFEYKERLNAFNKNFLTGFYFRHKKRYSQAEKYFLTAISIYPDSSKAKNELAIAYQRQNRYNDALDLAIDCYNDNPSNSFYIVTYFKSLVRSDNPNIKTLKKLIDDLDDVYDKNGNAFKNILEAEYKYFIDNDFSECANIFEDTLEEFGDFYPAYKSYFEICKLEKKEHIINAKNYRFDSNPTFDEFNI